MAEKVGIRKVIAPQYGVNVEEFISFLKNNGFKYIDGLTDDYIFSDSVELYVDLFKKSKVPAEPSDEESQEKKRALAKILISSGFNFDGYKIVKYSGYISGDDAVEIPRNGILDSTGKNSVKLTDALVRIRRKALMELKEAAYNLGCNAVIGVDFDYMTLEPERHSMFAINNTVLEPYVVCVTANGNAVVIEKEEK